MIEDLRLYLADIRRQRGMSQMELAAAMGTQQSAVSELENGVSGTPNVETLAIWAAVLGVDLTIQVSVSRSFRVAPRAVA